MKLKHIPNHLSLVPRSAPVTRLHSGAGALAQGMSELNSAAVAMAANHSNATDGEAMVTGFVTAGFEATHGEARTVLKTKLTQAEDCAAKIKERLDAVTAELLHTPAWVQASRRNQNRTDEPAEETPFREWQVQDKVEACLLSLAVTGALGASVLTAQSTLMASGLPVFLDQPSLAWVMALIPASGAVALKSFGALFHGSYVRAIYAIFLNVSAMLALLAWMVLYAFQYHGGLGGALDLFASPPAWRGPAFVITQLLAETLIGAALFFRLSQIASKYSPDFWFANLSHSFLSEEAARLGKEHVAQNDRVAALKGELAEYEAALALQIELAVMAVRQRRAQFS